jgi:release factor glutamine methyltransferase
MPELRTTMMDTNEVTIDIRAALRKAFQRLRQAQVPSHTLSAELLLMHVTGRDRAWLYAHPEQLLDRAIANQYFDLLERRSAGIPTQYLTGKQEFWGLEFEVSPAVLIPRPETEHVIEVALERLGHREKLLGRPRNVRSVTRGAGLTIADVGTGSGCIAIALAKELPEAKFYATDISSAALAVARRNASRHAALDRIQFVPGNLLDEIPRPTQGIDPESGVLNMIVSNPPYIGGTEKAGLPREVRDHEPESALYSGDQGTDLYAPLIRDAGARLNSGGILVLELGFSSLPDVRRLLDHSVWTDIRVTNDLAGIPRVLAAERL